MHDGDHTPTDEDPSWIAATRAELERYRAETGERVVTLAELYDFSEGRLASQFPDNDNVRAKIRQQLQRLRDREDVEFLDEDGTYRITLGAE